MIAVWTSNPVSGDPMYTHHDETPATALASEAKGIEMHGVYGKGLMNGFVDRLPF